MPAIWAAISKRYRSGVAPAGATVYDEPMTTTTEIVYKVRVGDDGTYVKCSSWFDAMQRKDALIARAGMAQVIACRDNGNTFVGLRTYHRDGRVTEQGAMQ